MGGGGLTPLQRCSQCILQPQLTGQDLMPNPVIVYITFLNKPGLIFCIQSNRFKYCYITLTNQMVWLGLVLWYINYSRLFNAKSSIYICIEYMIWFGLVLWHIKHYWLFNPKSCFSIYIKCMICKQIFFNPQSYMIKQFYF